MLPLILAACDVRAGLTNAGTSTPFLITATLPPTIIPSATLTPMPPTPSPTTVPVQGMTSTQVNVRSQPSAAASSLGMLPPFVNVQIVGSDADVNWYAILDPQGPDGMGWVSAQFITVPQGKDKIPVISGAATPTPENGTPAAGTAGASVTGTVIQQVNVRKGPGTTFDPVGTLNPDDTVSLIGKDPSGDWYQITYASAPDGKGWVAASFIQATGTENLPIVGAAGTVIGTGTPVAVAPVLTPTPAPAFNDQDSAQAPAVNIAFSQAGTQRLLYSSDLSAPQGDPQDWVSFTTFAPQIVVKVTCAGNTGIALKLTQAGTAVPGLDKFACGGTAGVTLLPDKPYLAELSIMVGGAPLNYVQYTLEIAAVP